MSGDSPPPKPKVGSLRDRIAAFEAKPAVAAAAPLPRPKPGNVQWKPKPVPSSPPAAKGSDEQTTSSPSSPERKAVKSGFSVADAKESIGMGGSLKERMAALQGKNTTVQPPPKPSTDKTKWKPPPPVVSPSGNEDDVERQLGGSEQDHASPSLGDDADKEGEQDSQENEPDAEEEERQRRAAIAARMARLGGARVGMGPPIFGVKPQPPPKAKKPVPSDSEQAITDHGVENAPEDTSKHSESTAAATATAEQVSVSPSDQSKPSDGQVSPDSQKSSRTPPTTMPVPSGPRRAAPPRKRPVKSSSPSATSVLSDTPSSIEEVEPSIITSPEMIHQSSDIIDRAKEDTTPVDDLLPPMVRDEKKEEEEEEVQKTSAENTSKQALGPSSTGDETTHNDESRPASVEEGHQESVEVEDEDEDSRRRRIAERIAKSGGFNPFAAGGPPLPRRQTSTQSASVPSPTSPALASPSSVSHSTPIPDVEVVKNTDVVSSADDDKNGQSMEPSAPVPESSSVEAKAESEVDDVPEDEDEQEEELLAKEETKDDRVVSEDSVASIDKLKEADELDITIEHDVSLEKTHGEHEANEFGRDIKEEVVSMPVRRGGVFDIKRSELDGQPSSTRIQKFDEDEDDEMAPPRIRRPLPPPPSENELVGNQRDDVNDESQTPTPPPLPSFPPKRRSLPPPRAPPPPPTSAPPEIPQDLTDEPPSPSSTSRVTNESDYDEGDSRDIESDDYGKYDSPVEEKRLPLSQQVKPSLMIYSPKTSNGEEVRDPRFPLSPMFPPPPPLPPNRPGRSTSLSPPPVDAVRQRLPPMSPPVPEEQEEEILDEADGDPIDPSFHSPARSALPSPVQSSRPLEVIGVSPAGPVDDGIFNPPSEGDAEASRRRSIADRVAKLGGFKFGAAIPRPARAPPTPSTDEPEEEESDRIPKGETPIPTSTEDEDEVARKARISARLVGMGALRMGLFAPIAAPKAPRVRSPSTEFERRRSSMSPPPRVRSPPSYAPPPRRTSHDVKDTDGTSPSRSATESDVSKIDAEESEPDEITHEEVEGNVEEEAPPPVPSRAGRPSKPQRQGSESQFVENLPPPLPSGRRGFSPLGSRPSSPMHSRQSTASTLRKGSDGSVRRPMSPPIPTPSSSGGDYVMVDEPRLEDEAPPPPPPPRRASVMSSRSTRHPIPVPPPPPPPSTTTHTMDSDGEWALPNIPTIPPLDFGTESDLSASGWSEVPPPPPPPPSSRLSAPNRSLPPQGTSSNIRTTRTVAQLNADELLALWGRVGVHVSEAAAALHDKSRKALIGDGTYRGFVNAALAEVPQAVVPSEGAPHEFGHLIYAQNGGTVKCRLAEIQPGDIIVLEDARFKGHKGLHQSYQQAAGSDGEPAMGVVGEFEHKKSKVKVFEANQHVGAQTVEQVSYRLEDLRSGSLAVYRISDL